MSNTILSHYCVSKITNKLPILFPWHYLLQRIQFLSSFIHYNTILLSRTLWIFKSLKPKLSQFKGFEKEEKRPFTLSVPMMWACVLQLLMESFLPPHTCLGLGIPNAAPIQFAITLLWPLQMPSPAALASKVAMTKRQHTHGLLMRSEAIIHITLSHGPHTQFSPPAHKISAAFPMFILMSSCTPLPLSTSALGIHLTLCGKKFM